MNRYAIYDHIGRILRVMTCHETQIEAQLQEGEAFLQLDEGDDSTHYVVAGGPMPLPAKPAEGWVFDYAARQWVAPAMDVLRAQRWEEIKTQRDSTITSGFIWNGVKFDSDPESQQRIAGAVQLAALAKSADQPYSVNWTLFDNSTRTMSADDMISVGIALGAWVQENFAKGQLARAQIAAAASPVQLSVVTFE